MMTFLGTVARQCAGQAGLPRSGDHRAADPDACRRRPPAAPFGTIVSGGLLIGLAAIIAVHLVMTRTAFGLQAAHRRRQPARRDPCRASGAAADGRRLRAVGGTGGLAGAVEILGVQGNVRADWNPAYGLAVIPLVFLARLNGFAAIVFVLLFSVLQIGGESAARRLGVPHYFTLVLVAILLIVLAAGRIVDTAAEAPEHGHDPVHAAFLTSLVVGVVIVGRPAASGRTGRADFREGRRAQHRHRGDDAGRRLCRLPRRLSDRVGLARLPAGVGWRGARWRWSWRCCASGSG